MVMPKHKSLDLDTIVDAEGNEVLTDDGSRSVGPSDSSDTGADTAGHESSDGSSDRNGTGERVDMESDVIPDADIGADRIITAEEAGLGGGLDQAEEARLGITAEEIDTAVRERLGLDRR
jgi:hypothetical protein